MAKAKCKGCLGAEKCGSMTLRLKVCLMLFVVMKPNRFDCPLRTVSAAMCHQYITKSADSGTSGQVRRTASTYPSPNVRRIVEAPINGGLPTMKSADGQGALRGLR